MIEVNIAQGSDSREWVEARLGITTASRFKSLVTSTAKVSRADTVTNYMHELLAEWQEGEPQSDWQGDENVEWGRAMEPEAFDYYALVRGSEPRKTGLVYSDERRLWAASPDGLVGDVGAVEGGIELKCPTRKTHLGYLLAMRGGEPPPSYRVQIQGSMWVTGARWWDFMSYHPGLPEVLMRIERDEAFMDAFDKAIPAFMSKVLEARQTLREMGVDMYMDREVQNG